MKKNKIKNGKWLYHLTSIDNLDSIIKNGLVSRKKLKMLKSDFVDIADQSIMEKRVGFNLDDYIPFHFHPYSAFDVFVKNNNPKKEFIYITIRREFAEEKGFKVIPKHPLTNEFKVYDYLEGLKRIDWFKMEMEQPYNEDVKLTKMAECLANQKITIEEFSAICVRNNKIGNIVSKKVQQYKKNSKLFISTKPWFKKKD